MNAFISDAIDAQTGDEYYYKSAVVIVNRANGSPPLSKGRSTGKRASKWYKKGGNDFCPDNSHLFKSSGDHCFRCPY